MWPLTPYTGSPGKTLGGARSCGSAEQTEDAARGNKVKAPLKRTHSRRTSPKPSLSPDVAMLHTGCDFCRHGKCKAQQLCITYCFYSLSLSLYFFAETASKRADQRLCRSHCAERQEGLRPPGATPRGPMGREEPLPARGSRDEHQGLCRVLAHGSPCDGAE